MEIRQLKEYDIIEERTVKDLNSQSYLLRHKKSGARLFLLSNDDKNKVFTIGFRTPPPDNTGVPHILEHSVLCGSKNYPVKDPFVELVKGSLNTFLNAMTYSDKTVYPVASTNDKDFQNLMNVYLDAVFFPNIYEKEEIFRQEGWHYELKAKDEDITYNGVVYNEMKGVYSSPEDMLAREIQASLFPDTAYGFESGGDPEFIPDLTYFQFLDFHSKYYHPSNSYIYLYGDMDMAEKLKWLDEEYLSKYDVMPIDSEIKLQKPFQQPIEIKKKYSITNDEPEENKTYLSYNVVVGDALDEKLGLAFQILEYALLTAPGAVLKQALLDAGIGDDVTGYYDDGILQPVFSVQVKNSNLDKKEEFIQIIRSTLEEVVAKKIDKKTILAGINIQEFRYREADFGNYPKGLMYGLQSFDSWLYDDTCPLLHLELLDAFAFLKEKANTDYFENLIQEYLLQNNHCSCVILEPEKGLSAKIEEKAAARLQQYKESLSQEQIEELIQEGIRFQEYQESVSTQEELQSIPILEREDIRRGVSPICNEIHQIGETTVLHHPVYTNGIAYMTLLFDVKQVPEELLPYLGLLKHILGYVDTKRYKYTDLFNEINLETGGISSNLNVYGNVKQYEEYKAFYEIQAKVLYEKIGFAFEIIEEILTTSNVRDAKRLKEIVARLVSRLQSYLVGAGHSSAVKRGMSYLSASAMFSDLTGGISFYKEMEKLNNNFEAEKEACMDKLETLIKLIFCKENLMVSYIAERGQEIPLKDHVSQLKNCLNSRDSKNQETVLIPEKKNEGFKTASQVQYVARTGNYMKDGFSYTGALRILKVVLSYDFLWKNIREQGGAYGCMSGFNRLGEGYMVSYRDPNLEKTDEVFKKVPEYLKNLQIEERDMVKYIIGTISELDVPLTPAGKGSRSLMAYLDHITSEDLQRERDEILQATVEDLRALAPIVASVLEDQAICVIGGEEKIEAQKQLFQEVKNLIG